MRADAYLLCLLVVFITSIILTLATEEVRRKSFNNVATISQENTTSPDFTVANHSSLIPQLQATYPLPQPPHFVTKNSTVIQAQSGGIASIPCVVKNLGEATVSWIRRKDYHLLTVGLTSYTLDERYQPVHYQNSEDWTLRIKYVQTRDAGLYECQISSHPPSNIFLDLQVVEAEAEIDGPVEKHLKYGSPLQLKCTVNKGPEIPAFIFWYHNNYMVNYDTVSGYDVNLDLANKTSVLYVSSATGKHAGNYSCVPSNARPDSTVVHILSGENPAAMQHGGSCGGLTPFRSILMWSLATVSISRLYSLNV